jgi:hypothetical protein
VRNARPEDERATGHGTEVGLLNGRWQFLGRLAKIDGFNHGARETFIEPDCPSLPACSLARAGFGNPAKIDALLCRRRMPSHQYVFVQGVLAR